MLKCRGELPTPKMLSAVWNTDLACWEGQDLPNAPHGFELSSCSRRDVCLRVTEDGGN